ncbi:WD40-repeat-containing domain [Pseudocohnilembus persalinus]|uniref:WD40-repeat-containing domain n=1 Tax=Pseudocohnilembus persalinus TaxID=266149 RepID=A0A0V0QN49_PSEPJ|nr:WD40-repeat-containing domain [Pseudocohnilembus persalinus]|eukprot:KRX03530.1 WD40-repeat-containing domain [Pseudocohnilembus persalinus]
MNFSGQTNKKKSDLQSLNSDEIQKEILRIQQKEQQQFNQYENQRNSSLLKQKNKQIHAQNNLKQSYRRKSNILDEKTQHYLQALRATGQKKKQERDFKDMIKGLQNNEEYINMKFKQKGLQLNQKESSQHQQLYEYITQINQVKVPGDISILNIRYDPHDLHIGVAFSDGYIKTYNEDTGKLEQKLIDFNQKLSPVSSIRWFPQGHNTHYLLASYSNGAILLYDTIKGELKEIYEKGAANTFQEIKSSSKINLFNSTDEDKLVFQSQKQNEYVSKAIECCDFNSSGKVFASGGYEQEVIIYDFETKQKINLKESQIPKHSNRIFNTLFLPDNDNLLMSAGWDNNILFWDLRVGTTVNYIYGPEICGDSLDYKNNKILAGSFRSKNQLEVFDMRKLQDNIYQDSVTIPWSDFNYLLEQKLEYQKQKDFMFYQPNQLKEKNKKQLQNKKTKESFIYSCKFSKNSDNLVLAGSTGVHELRLFDRTQEDQFVDTLKNQWNSGIFSIDFANTKSHALYGTGDGTWGQLQIK